MLYYNKNNKLKARELRNNMTFEERLLWQRIKNKQLNELQFYRQKPIGDYIVDFYCPKVKLVIEVDGGYHYNSINILSDNIRSEYLKSLGLKVLRFNNVEIKNNINSVVENIIENITKE